MDKKQEKDRDAQVKQERGDKKEAPGDVVWTRSKKKIEMPQVMWLFGSRSKKETERPQVIWLFGQEARKRQRAPG